MKSLATTVFASLIFFPIIALTAPTSLTTDQMAAAAQPESLIVPTPGEVFAAIDKQTKPNWVSMSRGDTVSETSTRPQIALNLGTLITDGYIAIEAQDGQGVKNIGKDILNVAKKLNVSQNLLARGNSLNEFAENNQWNTLKEELEATQNEVRLTMEEQKDQDLMTLLTLGAWIRGLEAASTVISNNYTPDAAKLLRQPAIVDYLLKRISLLPSKVQSNEVITTLIHQLGEVHALVNTPLTQSLSAETVKQINQIATKMMHDILSKTPPTTAAIPKT